MNLIKNSNLLLVILGASLVSGSKTFPSSIDRCKNEDKKCLVNSWNKYIKMSESMELSIPNLRAYFVDKLTITTSNTGPLNINIEVSNVTLSGLDTLVFEKIVGFPTDPSSMTKLVLHGTCPHVRVVGKYKAKGKVLLIPIVGEGNADISFYNIKYKITADTKTEVIDGEKYISIPKVVVNYVSEKNTYQLDNILNNKELSEGINKILNENQEVINPELIPPISKALGKIFKGILAPVFAKYPYRSFFLEP